MKKIIEVLDYGGDDIRFNTDLDVTKNHKDNVEVLTLSSCNQEGLG